TPTTPSIPSSPHVSVHTAKRPEQTHPGNINARPRAFSVASVTNPARLRGCDWKPRGNFPTKRSDHQQRSVRNWLHYWAFKRFWSLRVA
uniref:Uncharacterized protein n=2 Tax=Rhinopithecus TaxID=542827 RepID=A0A2K6K221_RHIBE